MPSSRKSRRLLGFFLVLDLVGALVARARGYAIGVNTLVRCNAGHVFTTIWIPGASVKSLRLGWWRVQRCPVGRHWTVVRPVRPDDLTDAERSEALATKDARIP